jgi:hypothetical protein
MQELRIAHGQDLIDGFAEPIRETVKEQELRIGL